jgi:membrane associated rhomboid family serine protease
MLGVQVAHDWVRRRQVHYNLFRRWAPIAIGAALLAWLGGDGRQIDPTGLPKTLGDLNVALPKIDVGAHLLGFAVGLLLGGLIGWTRPRFRLNARQQASLSAAVVGVFFFAWFVALR